jgi:hypothetical protein
MNKGERGQTGDTGITGKTGETGHVGERGDAGQRGVAGERGMKGDHGQHGEDGRPGDTGPAGATGRNGLDASAPLTRRTATILAMLCCAAFTAGFWLTEKDSCQRQSGVRMSAYSVASTASMARKADAENADREGKPVKAKEYRRLAAIYDRAAQKSKALDCGGLFPDTQ